MDKLGWALLVGGSFWFFSSKFKNPVHLLLTLSLQSVLGALGICLFNLVGQYVSLFLPINPYNSVMVGALGIPGLAVLLVVKYWIGI